MRRKNPKIAHRVKFLQVMNFVYLFEKEIVVVLPETCNYCLRNSYLIPPGIVLSLELRFDGP